ncbi:MAG: response regulator, partial [Pseudomonadota bacterium]
GKEAIRQLHENSYNAVLMDCMMPVMDGYSATREWRKFESEKDRERVPILAMTANAMAGDRQKCLDAGMDDYMAKPLNRQLLEQMLKRWLTEPAAPQLDPEEDTVPASVPAAEQADEDLPPGVAVLRPRKKAAAQKSVLDRQVLNDLIDIMGDEYVDLIEVYLEDTPNCIGQLAEAADADDIDGLIAPAHSLKSTSANLGAIGLSELAKAVEHGAREGTIGDVAQKLKAIQSEFDQVAAELQDIKAS